MYQKNKTLEFFKSGHMHVLLPVHGPFFPSAHSATIQPCLLFYCVYCLGSTGTV